MTKHRDVNKSRRQEKCKMTALIRQANKRVQNVQIEKIKKERVVEKKRKREKNKTKTLSEKKEEARNVSEQRDKGWIHVIRVHDTIHSADNNTAGQQTLTNYPTQRKNERFVKHRDYPPHSYIVNERYNSRNKRANQEKKQ